MIVKEVISEEMITLAEAKDILLDIKEKRTEEDMELGYELRRAINHAELFSRTDGPKSRELVEKLLELEKMKPEIAYRLADFMPATFDEIRSIYAKERFTLTEDEITDILDLITDAY